MIESKAISKEKFEGSYDWREVLDANKYICKLTIMKLWFVYNVDFDFILKFSIIISKNIKDIIFWNIIFKKNC